MNTSYTKGQVVVLTSGDYEDYSVCGVVRFTRDCTLRDLLTAFIEHQVAAGKPFDYDHDAAVEAYMNDHNAFDYPVHPFDQSVYMAWLNQGVSGFCEHVEHTFDHEPMCGSDARWVREGLL